MPKKTEKGKGQDRKLIGPLITSAIVGIGTWFVVKNRQRIRKLLGAGPMTGMPGFVPTGPLAEALQQPLSPGVLQEATEITMGIGQDGVSGAPRPPRPDPRYDTNGYEYAESPFGPTPPPPPIPGQMPDPWAPYMQPAQPEYEYAESPVGTPPPPGRSMRQARTMKPKARFGI